MRESHLCRILLISPRDGNPRGFRMTHSLIHSFTRSPAHSPWMKFGSLNCSASYTGNGWVIGHGLHSSRVCVFLYVCSGLVAPTLQSKREGSSFLTVDGLDASWPSVFPLPFLSVLSSSSIHRAPL